nr:hypothetical protein [Tanacetum cinerariifolium]
MVAEEEEDVVEEDPLLMDEDDIGQSMEDEYMQGLLDEQEDLRHKQEKEHQDKLDEEALHQTREEEFIFPDQEESMDVEMYNRTKASINFMVNIQESVTHGKPFSVEAANVQLAESEPVNVPPVQSEPTNVQPAQSSVEAVSVQPVPYVHASDNASKKKEKRTRSEPDAPFRIYHKNKGRSERIRNMQVKKFKFVAQGTRSTAEKAFDVSL